MSDSRHKKDAGGDGRQERLPGGGLSVATQNRLQNGPVPVR